MDELTEKRASGVLMHVTSLPPADDGLLGRSARRFVDWLVEAGQSYWQVLPVGPTGYGGSPYQTYSSFAGDATWLGRLRPVEDIVAEPEYEAFTKAAPWLVPYAQFTWLKQANDGQPWHAWTKTRLDGTDAQAFMRRICAEQFEFHRQWLTLKTYANDRGVHLIGDCPIYVAHDSAEVWSERHLFDLDADGAPRRVAGVPPDYFSATGQRWGNPLYAWGAHRAEQFRWWIARLARSVELFDVTRIDHFRGFDAYWAIDAQCDTAVDGEWLAGPGDDFFAAVSEAFGGLPFIAEDLGLLTESVHELRARWRLPGMRVLQFGFDDDAHNPHAPANVSRDMVCYTGTHDNDTTLGWYEAADDVTRDRVNALGNHDDPVGAMMTAAAQTDAWLAIFPMQDVLRLGSEARFNTPGTVGGHNWRWRLPVDGLTAEGSAKLRTLTTSAGRVTA